MTIFVPKADTNIKVPHRTDDTVRQEHVLGVLQAYAARHGTNPFVPAYIIAQHLGLPNRLEPTGRLKTCLDALVAASGVEATQLLAAGPMVEFPGYRIKPTAPAQ